MNNSDTKDIPKIKTYTDFIAQLNNVKESNSDIVLSFYRYCYINDIDNSKYYHDSIIDEFTQYGLIPYMIKISEELNYLIFKFKNKAEVILYIKPYGIDIFIRKF